MEAIAGGCWMPCNWSAQEEPEVATIWCLSCGRMQGVGGISPDPSGQVFETHSHPYNWHLGEVSVDRRGLSWGDTKLLFHLEPVAPAGQGWGSVTEIGKPELKPSLLLPTLCFAEKSQIMVPRSMNPTTFIDTSIFALYFHLATIVSKN